MVEIPAESLIEIWEMVSDGVPTSKKNDLAVRFIGIFVDHDIDLSDLDDLKDHDEHLDHAFDHHAEDVEDQEDFTDEDY
jgi:hypothetical protein